MYRQAKSSIALLSFNLAILLEDLELVLAQIAMLQSGRTRQEIDLITDALEERDVVPRIQSAVARLARGE